MGRATRGLWGRNRSPHERKGVTRQGSNELKGEGKCNRRRGQKRSSRKSKRRKRSQEEGVKRRDVRV